MQDIKIWEQKIQEKRKHSDRRETVRDIGSWFTIYFEKRDGQITMYPKTERIGKTVSPKEFEEARDGLVNQGVPYNFDQDFFHNFQYLYKNIPIANRIVGGTVENADFGNDVINAKNIYLSYGIVSGTINTLYTFLAKDNSNNILNSVSVGYNSENVYQSSAISSSYNIFYSINVVDSSNIWFSINLIGCQECLFCDGLQNKSYCIKNKEYTKEEYIIEKEKILKQKEIFLDWFKGIDISCNNNGSTNVTGKCISKSENIENGTIVYQVKDGRNLFMVGGSEGNKNVYDLIRGGTLKVEDIYAATLCGLYCQNIYCSFFIINNSFNIYYSHGLDNCSYCLGCIGLKNKQFCILNKQYTKEERFELADRIFQQMESDGILGKYFPGWMNPFYFNDTNAYLIDGSFTKEEIIKEGYLRRDENIKVDIPANAEIITPRDLMHYQGYDTNRNWIINKDILKKVIKDDKGNYYRIMPMELEFLQKYGLPLPEIHWLDRIKLGFKFK